MDFFYWDLNQHLQSTAFKKIFFTKTHFTSKEEKLAGDCIHIFDTKIVDLKNVTILHLSGFKLLEYIITRRTLNKKGYDQKAKDMFAQ